MQPTQSRRRFLATLSSAGAAGFLGASHSSAQEGPPETTTVRLSKNASICVAPQFVAEELLRAEGFTDVRFVEVPLELMARGLARGELDFASAFSPQYLVRIDEGAPITIVGGLHIGCFELLRVKPFAASWTSREKPSACKASGRPHTCSSVRWRRMLGSIRAKISAGSPRL